MGGLGEAICIKLAELGYKVVTTYSPGNTKYAGVAEGDEEAGPRVPRLPVRRLRLRLVRRSASQKVAAEVGPIDVLVNNAGITRDMTFKKMDQGRLGRGDEAPTSTASST